VPLAAGSDSNVCRGWAEDLRWLDSGQRLVHRQRNVAALPARHDGATAARLFERLRAGGAAAAGLPAWGLQRGARADCLVLDMQNPGLLGVPPSHALDALVFATAAPALSEVWVAGRRVVARGVHVAGDAIATDFAGAMAALWPA
ncbi:MAG TPA: formimidoylglutamate deiminase, partial [Rubrivivax sp.]|nr:formimidoylglutamate deiminase [Rubrivivax sp.]